MKSLREQAEEWANSVIADSGAVSYARMDPLDAFLAGARAALEAAKALKRDTPGAADNRLLSRNQRERIDALLSSLEASDGE